MFVPMETTKSQNDLLKQIIEGFSHLGPSASTMVFFSIFSKVILYIEYEEDYIDNLSKQELAELQIKHFDECLEKFSIACASCFGAVADDMEGEIKAMEQVDKIRKNLGFN